MWLAAALWDLLKVGSGIASAVFGTAIMVAALAAFVAAWLGIAYLVRTYLSQLSPSIICMLTACGFIQALQTFFGIVASAIAVRTTRFLAIRANEAFKLGQ